ncbi:MAG TPA: ABC transporter ATP-binding protein, partial [Actinomycetota bacterium]|nr:ABC transporter ATP-binding protein [Actinomycetota bacterium]
MGGLTLDGIVKRYGSAEVVRDVSLQVHDGELLVLLGPSGCGKTTILRIIAGLERCDAGAVTIDGRDVTRAAPSARDVAMVFQSHALFPHLTVRGNLGFGLAARKRPGHEIAARVESVAGSLGIAPLLERKPSQLSGGERQRVALGRAMVREPAIFLMDEPLSSLDAQLRAQMRAEIARLQASLGTTTLYVTHDQVEALGLGHR